MELNHFLQLRRSRWQRLSDLLDQADANGLNQLPQQDIDQLFSLYRLVSSDLNLAQTHTANPALLEYLESLVARAYANLAVPRKAHPFRAWWRIVRHRFPAIIRQEKRLFALATAMLVAGACFGYTTTAVAPETNIIFLPAEQLVERPAERVARLEALESSGDSQVGSADQFSQFAAFLFTHNIRVTVLGFCLGLTAGLGTTIILFYNGAMLGSLAWLYYKDGVMTFFIAWIGPHGSIELPCILFGCTAGFMLARTQINVEKGTTLQQIRQLRPRLIDLLIGTSTLLVIAGIIEGWFSQVNEPTLPYPLKISVAAFLFISLLAYLFWMPVDADALDDHNKKTSLLRSLETDNPVKSPAKTKAKFRLKTPAAVATTAGDS